MKTSLPVGIPMLLLALAVTLPAAEKETKSLFDGKSLAGWSGNKDLWRVEGEKIVGEIKAGTTLARNEFLFWDGEVADFELTFLFDIEGHPSANSGVQFRSQRQGATGAAGYQADLDQQMSLRVQVPSSSDLTLRLLPIPTQTLSIKPSPKSTRYLKTVFLVFISED